MNSKNTGFSSSIAQSIITFLVCFSQLNDAVYAQRSPYAGSRPQGGYKDRFRPSIDAPQQDIVSRFGDDLNRVQRPPVVSDVVQPLQNYIPINAPSSNQLPDVGNRNSIDSSNGRLPYDALGDRTLVDQLNRLPLDQRPFWLVNAQAIEAHRNRTGAQLDNFNPIAQRGSFAGSGLSTRSNSNAVAQQQLPQPSLASLSNRGDFASTSGSSLVDFGGNNQQQSNRVSLTNAGSEIDSQGGRFVYVGPQLYNQLKKSNLVV